MNTERIAFLAAFRIEVEGLVKLLEEPGPMEKKGFLRHVRGRRGARRVLVGTTGMGKARAAAGTQAALDLFDPDLLVFCGTAGSLRPQVRPLDVVMADRVLEHDTGPKEPAWIEAARLDLGSEVIRGGLISGDRPVLDAAERETLASRYDALAVDMEAAAALAVAQANGVRAAAVKAITDRADGSGVNDFRKNVERCAERLADLLRTVMDAS
jgi:adenosylhomocysteine nucleosidase